MQTLEKPSSPTSETVQTPDSDSTQLEQQYQEWLERQMLYQDDRAFYF